MLPELSRAPSFAQRAMTPGSPSATGEEDAAASSSELDESGHLDDLPATDDGLRDLRARSINQAANDSLAPPIRLLLFVSRSYASRRMLRTARELVQRIGDDRVKLAVADVEDPSSAADMAKHRITFTPTLVLETSKARTRVVGAAELREVAALIPYFYDSLID